MRKIRLKQTESYCQKYLYTKIMTSKCKINKYKLNANIFFQIYFCSTFSVRIQKVKINWKGRRLFERRHSKNTIWCESTVTVNKDIFYSIRRPIISQLKKETLHTHTQSYMKWWLRPHFIFALYFSFLYTIYSFSTFGEWYIEI